MSKSKQDKLNQQMREILASAYGFIRGREATKGFSSLTYDQLLDSAIGRIEGTDGRGEVRATLLDRIDRIKNEIVEAVKTVKERPPHEWVIEGSDTNTKEDYANTEE